MPERGVGLLQQGRLHLPSIPAGYPGRQKAARWRNAVGVGVPPYTRDPLLQHFPVPFTPRLQRLLCECSEAQGSHQWVSPTQRFPERRDANTRALMLASSPLRTPPGPLGGLGMSACPLGGQTDPSTAIWAPGKVRVGKGTGLFPWDLWAPLS